MLAATHFDNLLILLFFAAAIIFQILTKAASKGRKRPPDTSRGSTPPSQTSRPLSREENGTDEERIRKFLEALGQPTTSKPPAPVAPRPTYQRPVVLPQKEPEPAKRRSVLSPLPPLTTRPPDSPLVKEPLVFEVRQGPPPPEPIAEADVRATFQPSAQTNAKPYDVAAMLRSTSNLRNAIILREVFGPPRSLQPLDLVGSV